MELAMVLYFINEFLRSDAIAKAHKLGFVTNFIFSMYAGFDAKNLSRVLITFDEPYLGLSRAYFMKGINSTEVKNYYELMQKECKYLLNRLLLKNNFSSSSINVIAI